MTAVEQVLGLVGSTATAVPIDATGVQYDGLSRLSWPFSTPSPYEDARLVVAGSATQTDAELDLILRDYNAGSDVATIVSVNGDDPQFFTKFDPNAVDGTADVGLRVDVTSASGTGGATVDLDAKVVLLP
jgi:hypothetical protein